MKTTYQFDAEKAEERLRKMMTNQIAKSNTKIAEEHAYLCGYKDAINNAIEALIHWELENSCKNTE